MYGISPLLIHKAFDGSSSIEALLMANSSDQFVDLYDSVHSKGTSCHWMADSGHIELFVLSSKTPRDYCRKLAILTGK